MRDRQLLVNGQPVLIHGVNHHDTDPDRGRSMTPEAIDRDLRLMKQHNLNAVRPPTTRPTRTCSTGATSGAST